MRVPLALADHRFAHANPWALTASPMPSTIKHSPRYRLVAIVPSAPAVPGLMVVPDSTNPSQQQHPTMQYGFFIQVWHTGAIAHPEGVSNDRYG